MAAQSGDVFARYERQIRFSPFGLRGQKALFNSRALVVGMGALGSASSELLVRAGVGRLRIVDRDFLELSNLQRQSLYTERDVADGLPKAIAAAHHLSEINSHVDVEPIVADVSPANVAALFDSVHVVVDGTDNFETRFLLNDASVSFGIPWIYGGCLGCDGQTMTIIPGQTACLRCLMPEGPPAASELPTCDTAGIFGSIIHVVAAMQALEAIKILSGNQTSISRDLQAWSMWENRSRQINLSTLRERANCPACTQRQFDWLKGTRASQTAILCGRNAVQISPGTHDPVDLKSVATRLTGIGQVRTNPYLLKLSIDTFELTLFADGRAIIGGTQEIAVAKRLYAQYFGN